MTKKTKGEIALTEHGFTEVVNVRGGTWFKAKAPNGEAVALLRQGAGAWHAFFAYRATASGGDPKRALTGGLGDVIGDAFAMMSYCHAVRNAPDSLVMEFDGLYGAGVQVVN